MTEKVVKEQLLGFLTSLGCNRDDDAVLEYAAGVLSTAVEEEDDEAIAEHLEHIDMLLAGACGERYEATGQEERFCQLSAILDAARRVRAEPPKPTAATGISVPRTGQDSAGLSGRLSGLTLSAPSSVVGSGGAGGSGRRQENVSPAGEPAGPRGVPPVVRELMALCSGAVSEEFLVYALGTKFEGSAEDLAAWLVDSDASELREAQAAWEQLREREAREQEEARLLKERNKQQVLQRFDLRPVSEPKVPKKAAKAPMLTAWTDKQEDGKKPKVRYLDGRVVSTKGEKFIIEKTGEEWDGGSRGKVYTKGKRGKGFM